MQEAQFVELRPEDLEIAACTKRLVTALKRGSRGQQLHAHLPVLFGCLFHEAGVAVEPWELAGQCHELLIKCADPNPVQARVVPYHAIDDGMGPADTLGDKLLHVLTNFAASWRSSFMLMPVTKGALIALAP